jgi:hypothetical protein
VVRIEDPKAGREGYTFDLEWQGSAPNMPPPGVPPVVAPIPGDTADRDRGRDRDRDRDRDRQHFGAEEAVRQCSEQAEGELRRSGYLDTRVTDGKMDGEPGHGDWIYGKLTGRRGLVLESFGFACGVDIDADRVGPVRMRPANDGYYGGGGVQSRFTREQAFDAMLLSSDYVVTAMRIS